VLKVGREALGSLRFPRLSLAGILVHGPTRGIPQFQSWTASPSGGGKGGSRPACSAQGRKAPEHEASQEQADRIGPGDPARGHEERRKASHDQALSSAKSSRVAWTPFPDPFSLMCFPTPGRLSISSASRLATWNRRGPEHRGRIADE
jgi:hypothetical protein